MDKDESYDGTSHTCAICEITFARNFDLKRHLNTLKHTKRSIQSIHHECKYCSYSTSLLADWNKHMQTKKHMKRVEEENDKQLALVPYMEAINQLIDENKEMRNFLVEEFRRISTEHNSETQKIVSELKLTNNINNGTINNKFNINFFLNEQCKDAENMTDFVRRIIVSREDLENNAHLGFVNGISKIFIDNLRQLDVHKRPIHCTDIKRETIYIKDDNKWSREDDDAKMRQAVQEISRKSVGTLIEWKQTNPDYIDGDSEFSLLCIPMLRHSIAGDDREVFFPKVIRNVLREVSIK